MLTFKILFLYRVGVINRFRFSCKVFLQEVSDIIVHSCL